MIGYKPFYHANQFLTDNVSGILFAFCLWVFPENKNVSISPLFVKRFRKIADYTFPIYVLHYPIIKLTKVLFVNVFSVDKQFYLSILISIVVSVFLGEIFERNRSLWNRLFKNIINGINVFLIRK